MTDPRLDRRVEFDENSRNFRAVVGIEDKPLRSYTWSCGPVLDQGYEGACVGFAWTHELAARPAVVTGLTDAYALGIYRRAKQIDPWPGEDYSGTSVLAGVKAVMEQRNASNLPYYGEYRWAFGINDVLRVVGYKGPLVLGINWYENMYDPNSSGFISASGEIAGGHAILLNGVKIVKKPDHLIGYSTDNLDVDRSYVRLHNSWGLDYGFNGEAFLTVRDLDKLLREDGEACIPSLRRV